MNTTKKIAVRRDAFTLVEMMVVIAIMLALAALAAAFAPRVNDNQKLTRAVDLVEQWLLTAKMRAKHDGLATGLRFVQAPGDAVGTYSQFQYIQQPQPLIGGICVGFPTPTNLLPPAGAYQFPDATQQPPLGGNFYVGGIITAAGSSGTGTAGQVNFMGVDFSLGGLPQLDAYGRQQWLVQTGDSLEINGGGVYFISSATSATTVQLSASTYANLLSMGLTATPPTPPTTNYRIIRQPRILLGEEPLTLPTNYAAVFSNIPGTTVPASNVALGPSLLYPEIVFSPTGAVVGNNSASSTVVISVWDTTMQPFDPNLVGVVGIQSRSGFIGAYGLSPNPTTPFYFVQTARASGL